jgi:glyoxylase-like metal-dependent hydrolase (beta-lactamase superfamily II)
MSIMKNWFTIKQINSNVWGIGEFDNSEEVVSYLIMGKKRAMLIDSGLGILNIRQEIEKITKNLPIILVNTHCHFDHIGGNHLFEKVLIPNDNFAINAAAHGVSTSQITEYFDVNEFKDLLNGKPYQILPFKYTRLLEDQDVIDLAPFKFQIIKTPGHSSDSICLFEKENGWLFAGDTLYDGPIFLHLAESNFADYMKSIQKLLKLPKIDMIFPGHNGFYMDNAVIEKINSALVENEKFALEKIDDKGLKSIEIEGRLKLVF